MENRTKTSSPKLILKSNNNYSIYKITNIFTSFVIKYRPKYCKTVYLSHICTHKAPSTTCLTSQTFEHFPIHLSNPSFSFTSAGVPEDWTVPPFHASRNKRSPGPAGKKRKKEKRSKSIHLQKHTLSQNSQRRMRRHLYHIEKSGTAETHGEMQLQNKNGHFSLKTMEQHFNVI